MNMIHPSPLLKTALRADALLSGAAGVLQLAAADRLAALIEMPRALLAGSGEFMLVYALALLVLASRHRLPSWLVMFVVIGNLLWALACLALPSAGALALNPAGIGFLLVHVVSVTVWAGLEWLGLRRSVAATPGPLPRPAPEHSA